MTLLTWLRGLVSRKPTPVPTPPPPPPPGPVSGSGSGLDPTQLLLLAYLNRARSGENYPPLTWDDRLGVAASRHAEHMARTGRLGHDLIGDGTVEDRLHAAGYPFLTAAENVAFGYASADLAVVAWMADPPHRANILGPYRHVGGASAVSITGMTYWCADFGFPLSSS